MTARTVRAVLADAAARLRAPGWRRPRRTPVLLAFVCGIEPARLPLLDEIDDDAVAAFEVLVASRAAASRCST